MDSLRVLRVAVTYAALIIALAIEADLLIVLTFMVLSILEIAPTIKLIKKYSEML